MPDQRLPFTVDLVLVMVIIGFCALAALLVVDAIGARVDQLDRHDQRIEAAF